MLRRILTFVLAGLLLPLYVSAETVYVDDKLRVGLRTEPSNSVAPTGVVVTGMKLVVLDRRDGFIQIRTEDGREGWVSDNYVTADKPAMLIVEELQEKSQKLLEEAAQKDDLIKSAESTAAQLSKDSAALQDANAELRVQLIEAKQSALEPAVNPYVWFAIVWILTGLVGFAAGVFWYRREAMRRLGGMRL